MTSGIAKHAFSGSRFQKLSDELEEYRKLTKGWDTYRARPPLPATIESAGEFLKFLDEKGRLPDDLKPSVVGGVGFTFQKEIRRVYIEFRNSGTVHALFSDDVTLPQVVKVVKSTEGFQEILTQVEKYLNEQETDTPGSNGDQRS